MLSKKFLRRTAASVLSSALNFQSSKYLKQQTTLSTVRELTCNSCVLHNRVICTSVRRNSTSTASNSNNASSTSTCSSASQTESEPSQMSPSMGKGNYFAFFDLPQEPDLDVSELQKLYHNLQRKVHPDQENVQSNTNTEHNTENSNEGHKSDVDISSYANAAYETLRDPFKRCRYLSRLCTAQANKGSTPLTVTEEEELATEDDKRSLTNKDKVSEDMLSESFLSEILAMHELIFFSDSTDESVQKQLVLLRADLKERNAGYYEDCKHFWAAHDLENFRYTVMKWTYVHNALHHLIQKMENVR